jgi:carotenoid cleavage dioxygenase-like enzyme
MSQIRFPHNDFKSIEAPLRLEADIRGLEVIQGVVPEEINGSYYRVMPDRRWPSFIKDDIFLNEDGMAMYFRFAAGQVDFRSRYVRTPRFQAEDKAGRALFGAYRNHLTDDPSVKGVSRGLANILTYFHAGKLLALKEDSLPVLMDPLTLETLDPEYDFDGAVTSKTFTAHPKIDPRTGEMIAFAYAAKGPATPDIAYYEMDASGRVIHEAWIQAPYAGMVHDIAVTQNFVVFIIVPLRSEYEWLERNETYFKWDPNEQTYLGVLPRKGNANQLRWFRGPTRSHGHVLNAFDDGRHIHIDGTVSLRSFLHFFPNIDGSPFDPRQAVTFITRWSIDPAAKDDGFTERRLLDVPGEMPRIDPRFETLPYGWGAMIPLHLPDPSRAEEGGPIDLFQSICTLDPGGAKAPQIFHAGATSSVSEPQFVPARKGAAEGEGYILTVVGRSRELRTDLVILDAQRIERGPVATVALPIRLRTGGHSSWVSADQLA